MTISSFGSSERRTKARVKYITPWYERRFEGGENRLTVYLPDVGENDIKMSLLDNVLDIVAKANTDGDGEILKNILRLELVPGKMKVELIGQSFHKNYLTLDFSC